MERLWTPAECADYLRVSERYLRRSNCPRVRLPSGRGSRPLTRYEPQAVRAWYEARRMTLQRAS